MVTSIQSPQCFIEVHPNHRFNSVCRLLDEMASGRVIIFCRTKRDVDHLSQKLTLLRYRVSAYHGDLSTKNREKTVQDFIHHKTDILILTDMPFEITEFPNIDMVIFYVIPQDPDSYIQRITRLESTLSLKKVLTLIAPPEFKKIAFIKRVTKTDITKEVFKPLPELMALSQERIIKQLTEYEPSSDEDGESLLAFAGELLANYDPQLVVSFLLKAGYSRQLTTDTYGRMAMASSNKTVTDSGADDTPDDMERLFIAIGKTDDVDEEKLRSFLVHETNIDGTEFSDFKLLETFSFFVVSKENADIIIEIFRRKKRGKRSIVERAKGKDATKK